MTSEQLEAGCDRAIEAALDGFENGLRGCLPLISENIQKNYETEATAAGQPWAPHAPATVRRYGPHKILHLTGAMESASLSDGVEHIEEVSGNELRFGVSGDAIPYATFHRTGTARMPAREFMEVSEETVDRMTDVMADACLAQIMESFTG